MSSSQLPDTTTENNTNEPSLSAINRTPAKAKEPRTRLYVLLAIGLLVIGVAIGIFYNKSKQQDEQNVSPNDSGEVNKASDEDKATISKQEENKAVLTVDVVSPQMASVPLTITVDGVVVAENTASVSSKVAGLVVEEILVKEGDLVKQGQLLAKLDSSQLEQNVIQAQAQIVQATARLNNATATLERVKPLLEIDAVSKQEVDNYATQAKQAKASLVLAEAQYNNQMLRLKDSKVLAPVSGIISKKTANVGGTAQGSLFTIIENGKLEWQAKVNPNNINQLKVGSAVKLTTPTQEEIYGEVSRVEPTMGNDRQVNVRVKLQADEKMALQTGMLLTGEILLGQEEQQVVPVSSIIGEDGYNYLVTVTKLEKDNHNQVTGVIKRIKVRLGKQIGKAVALKTKVPEDVVVALQGGAFVSDGDKVRLNISSTNNTSSTNNASTANTPATISAPTNNGSTANAPATISAPMDNANTTVSDATSSETPPSPPAMLKRNGQ